MTAQSMLIRKILAIVIAGVLAAAAGGLAVSILGARKFVWSGLALLPLFVLLESVLSYVVSAFRDPNDARMWLAGAIVVCFYAGWMLLRFQ